MPLNVDCLKEHAEAELFEGETPVVQAIIDVVDVRGLQFSCIGMLLWFTVLLTDYQAETRDDRLMLLQHSVLKR